MTYSLSRLKDLDNTVVSDEDEMTKTFGMQDRYCCDGDNIVRETNS